MTGKLVVPDSVTEITDGAFYGDKDASNHTGKTTVVNKKPASCGTAGYTGDTKCECGVIVAKGKSVVATGKHSYSNACDTSCNNCSVTRTIKHTYANDCDKECDVCKATRIVSHNYAPATCTAPKTCKVCGTTDGKALGHKYTDACDTSCNTCKTTRKITHAYKSVTTKATLKKNGKQTTKCTVCGDVYKTTTVYYPKTIKLEYTSTSYNGKAQKPKVTVKDSKGKTVSKDNYTVKYAKDCKNPGKYTVTVTFKGKYEGTKKLTFTIKPKKVTLSKVTAGTKQLTATWKTVTGATGYEVMYSTSGKFSSKTTKTATVKKGSSKKTTIKKLTKVKKYYVRVRAYKTVDGKKIYGAWSAVKSVKIK